MAKKVIHVCDRCGDQLTYTDTDCDDHHAGIRIEGDLDFKVHERHASGSSHWPVPSLTSAEFCSYDCFLITLEEALEPLKRFKRWDGGNG